MTGVFSLANTLSGQNTNTLEQAALERLFQEREQQINALPPPQPMGMPGTPSPWQTGLSLLAASIGDALLKRGPQFAPVVASQLNEGYAAPARVGQANKEAMGKFQEDRAKKLHELSVKRLDAQVELLKQQGKNAEAARVALEAHNLKKDFEQFKNELGPSQETIYKETEATKRKGMPTITQSTRTTDVNYDYGTGSGGGKTSVWVGGTGGKPTKITLINPNQYFTRLAAIDNAADMKPEDKIARQLELASLRRTDDQSAQDIVDRLDEIDPEWSSGEKGKMLAAKIARAFNEVQGPGKTPAANRKTGKVEGSLIYR